MLKIIRVTLALVCFICITMLFLDFTGVAPHYWGWLAKWQFMPAVLSNNTIVLVVLLLVPFILGRVYCSVLCPLGVMQDIISWIHRKVSRRHKFGYRPQVVWLRALVLFLFVVLIMLGLTRIALYVEPYSEFGRIVSSLVKPVYVGINNLLASSQSPDAYTFYTVDYYVSWSLVVVSLVTFIVVGVMAWVDGRIYCNTICPVGTILGYLSQFAILKPVINDSKCVKCGKCARECKSSCIDFKNEKIDYTRCVTCMDCIGNCSTGAITYTYAYKKRSISCSDTAKDAGAGHNEGRRKFVTIGALLATTAAIKAQDKLTDGGLADIIDKKKPVRKVRVTPPGSSGHDNFYRQCTACQLCVSNCPNGVLRPSSDADTFMQPEMSFERGYCRPECTACSDVCPVGAIHPIDVSLRSAIQVGHAVWIRENCLPANGGDSCGNCARHCPVNAITMVSLDPDSPDGPKVPSVNTERCIGCGACENLCPVRPFSAIYVEGHERHRIV